MRRLKASLADPSPVQPPPCTHGGTQGGEYDNELCGNGQTDCGDWDDKRTAYSSLKGFPITCRDPPSPALRLNQRDAAGFVVVVTELAASLLFACLPVLTFSASLGPIAITSF